MRENELATIVVDLCLKIHRSPGPGLLDSVYEDALCYELKKMGLDYSRQQEIPVMYEGIQMQGGFRADVIVEGKLLIEQVNRVYTSCSYESTTHVSQINKHQTRSFD